MNKNDWQTFKIKFKISDSDIEPGLTETQIDNTFLLPVDLIELLKLNNGQKNNSTPLFCWFDNSPMGQIIREFIFLNFTSIRETYEYIQQTTKLDKSLIPFAKYNKTLGDSGTMAFTINTHDNSVHLTYFYEYDRFVTVYEHRTNKISENLDDFIKTQTEFIDLLKRNNTSH